MDERIYRVLSRGGQWRLEHDGRSIAYTTRTAAIEAAVDAAQGALLGVAEVKIHVEPAPCQTTPSGSIRSQ